MTNQKDQSNREGNTTTPVKKRAKLTREEIFEKKVNMAKERGARVIKINSPLGSIMFNVLRQFDQAYANFKGRLGEPGGISYEEGAELMEKAREITMEFSELTKELSKKVDFRYYTPEELKAVKAPQGEVRT
ncbi:recombinase [Desulfogranum marinum]|uniref:recombinase n=1 Tax=Desulfogranum marinum TaxID=453220 RepID=UPI00196269B8|nr:recombinase [Desulfogranum marinum]MBM9514250.1 recombinase [Desulfogranum marinum]